MGYKCEFLEDVSHLRINHSNAFGHLSTDHVISNDSLLQTSKMADQVQENESGSYIHKASKCEEAFKQDENDCENMEMEDYAEMGEVDATERALCDDCQMDYDDTETKDFNTEMRKAEETGSRGKSKTAMIFSGIGIGVIFGIVAVSVATYFGIKRCKSSRTSDNESQT